MNLLIEARLLFSLVHCFPLFNEMKFQHCWSLMIKWVFSCGWKTKHWENTEVKNRQQHSPFLGNFSPSVCSQMYSKLSISQQFVHHTNNIFFSFHGQAPGVSSLKAGWNIQATNILRMEYPSVFWTGSWFLDTRSILKSVF